MLYANTGKARISVHGHECPYNPLKLPAYAGEYFTSYKIKLNNKYYIGASSLKLKVSVI